MAINLSGYWKSVDNQNLEIKSDSFFYRIIQSDNNKELFILGYESEKMGNIKNIGYGKSELEIEPNSEIEISWGNVLQKLKANPASHLLKAKILDNNSKFIIQVTEIIDGQAKSFGNWEQI